MKHCIIKDIGNEEKGLFSKLGFNSNQVIFRFDGLQIINNNINDNFLQIGVVQYLNLKDHYSFFLRHHCNANCYVKIAVNNAFLISLRQIFPGDELTFDYSLTSTDTSDTWSMPCSCSQFYCRKVISGFSSLPEDKKARYIEMGIVPKYLIK